MLQIWLCKAVLRCYGNLHWNTELLSGIHGFSWSEGTLEVIQNLFCSSRICFGDCLVVWEHLRNDHLTCFYCFLLLFSNFFLGNVLKSASLKSYSLALILILREKNEIIWTINQINKSSKSGNYSQSFPCLLTSFVSHSLA